MAKKTHIMKKNLIISLLYVCPLFVFTNCSQENTNDIIPIIKTIGSQDNNELYKNIEKDRLVITGKDTLRLDRFELFSILTFKEISLGMYKSLEFENQNENLSITFDENWNNFTHEEGNNDKVFLKLKMFDGILKRELTKGQKYKVIFSFKSDSEALRSNGGSENISGYYIVDIVSLNAKFQRQIPVEY
jgi:hypothetical protein